MCVVIEMNTEKRGAGRPRKHDLMTPLRQWVIETFKGNYVLMAEHLGIEIQSLEKILTGAEYPGAKLAKQIKKYVLEHTPGAEKPPLSLDDILDYDREACRKTAA
jgi:hypothetical protein